MLAICLLTSTTHAEELRILAWNVENDGNDPNVIVRQLNDLSGYDIVGLTEVKASSIKKYFDALSASGNTFLTRILHELSAASPKSTAFAALNDNLGLLTY